MGAMRLSLSSSRGNVQCTLAALILMAFLVGGFLSAGNWFLFDDATSLQFNRTLELEPSEALSWRSAVFSGVASPLGRPVSMLSFAIQSAIDGEVSPHRARLVNLVLHAGNALLVAFVCSLLLSAMGFGKRQVRSASLIAALLWLLQPVHVSAYFYPIQRMAQLATMFALIAYWVFLKLRTQAVLRPVSAPRLVNGALWIAFFVLMAVLSKETGVLVLWIIVWTEYAVFRGNVLGRQRRWLIHTARALSLAPLILMAWAVLDDWSIVSQGYAGRDFTLPERVLSELRILWTYLFWNLVPWVGGYGFFHDDFVVSRSLFDPLSTLQALIGWCFVIGFAFYHRRSHPVFFFTLGFFFIGHSLESSILPLELVFEHRNYLPSIAPAMVLALLLTGLTRRWVSVRPMLPAVVPLLLVAALLVPLFHRMWLWSTPQLMAAEAVRLHPTSPRAHFTQAGAYKSLAVDVIGEPDRQMNYLIAARASLEQMGRVDRDAIAPPILLYIFDSRYFPGNPQHETALTGIRERLNTELVGATEFNALVALLECLERACPGDPQVVDRLFRDVGESFPRHPELLKQRVRFLARRKRYDEAMNLVDNAVDQGVVANGGELRIEIAAVQRDTGAALEAVVQMYAGDPALKRLHWYGALLGEPEG